MYNCYLKGVFPLIMSLEFEDQCDRLCNALATMEHRSRTEFDSRYPKNATKLIRTRKTRTGAFNRQAQFDMDSVEASASQLLIFQQGLGNSEIPCQFSVAENISNTELCCQRSKNQYNNHANHGVPSSQPASTSNPIFFQQEFPKPKEKLRFRRLRLKFDVQFASIDERFSQPSTSTDVTVDPFTSRLCELELQVEYHQILKENLVQCVHHYQQLKR